MSGRPCDAWGADVPAWLVEIMVADTPIRPAPARAAGQRRMPFPRGFIERRPRQPPLPDLPAVDPRQAALPGFW